MEKLAEIHSDSSHRCKSQTFTEILIYIGLDWIGSFSGNVTMKNLILISVTSILIIDINVQEHRIKNVLTKPSRYI